MIAYVNVNDEQVEQAIEQIRQWHQQNHGTGAASLVWALAHERVAREITEEIAQEQSAKARGVGEK